MHSVIDLTIIMYFSLIFVPRERQLNIIYSYSYYALTATLRDCLHIYYCSSYLGTTQRREILEYMYTDSCSLHVGTTQWRENHGT